MRARGCVKPACPAGRLARLARIRNAGRMPGPMAAEQPTLLEGIRGTVAADLAAVDATIRRELASDVALVNQVSEYIIGAGGKRLRPLLVLLGARAAGAPRAAAPVARAA